MTTHRTQQRSRLHKGDTVKVLAGVDRGKKGKIEQVLPRESRAVVEGVNMRSKHVRSRQENQKGERIDYHAPVALQNLALVCPKCNKSTRIGITLLEGKKYRTCKKCQQHID